MKTIQTPAPLTNHTTREFQIWVSTPADGPIYAYRTGLIASVARNWSAAWNKDRPADVPQADAEFVVVIAETTFTAVEG